MDTDNGLKWMVLGLSHHKVVVWGEVESHSEATEVARNLHEQGLEVMITIVTFSSVELDQIMPG